MCAKCSQCLLPCAALTDAAPARSAGLAVHTVYGSEPYWPEKKLRICITGAGGFIASHLAKRLKEEGHYVIGCDWKRNEHMSVRCAACSAGATRLPVWSALKWTAHA